MDMNIEDDFQELIKIYTGVLNANQGIASIGDDRIVDAEGLGVKFFGHTIAFYHLYKGMTIPDIVKDFVDPSSINVVGRAAIETFLVFHYVFASPETDDEKNFKYFSWELGGLVERQKLQIRSTKGKAKLEQEKLLIDSLKTKIDKNPCFIALGPKQKKKLVSQGAWRLNSWRDISLSAGLSEILSNSFYRYLCGHAHSSNLSVVQVRQAVSRQERERLVRSTYGLILIATANMIKSYCSAFPTSKEYYKHTYPKKNVVDIWSEVGSETDKDCGIDWDNLEI